MTCFLYALASSLILLSPFGCRQHRPDLGPQYRFEIVEGVFDPPDQFTPITTLKLRDDGMYAYTVHEDWLPPAREAVTFHGKFPSGIIEPFLYWAAVDGSGFQRGSVRHWRFSIERPTWQPVPVYKMNEYVAKAHGVRP